MLRFVGVIGSLAAFGITACASEGAQLTQVDKGKALVSDTKLSASTLNFASCSTCHRFEPGERPDALLPGATLAGATLRRSFWAGQELDLLRSINQCRYFFMASSTPWTDKDESAIAIYAYLRSLEPLATAALKGPIPFSVVQDVSDVPAGAPAAGEGIFNRACRNCHGSAHRGDGRLKASLPVLPEESVEAHQYLGSRDATRLVFIEKTRHGGFLGYGGLMPPFSKEVLSDKDLGALLAFLGLY